MARLLKNPLARRPAPRATSLRRGFPSFLWLGMKCSPIVADAELLCQFGEQRATKAAAIAASAK